MLNFGFLEGNKDLPLSFASLKELRSIYRFLRLFREELSSHREDHELSFVFILEDHERQYAFPSTFLEFEQIIRDQSRYAKILQILNPEISDDTVWLCNLDLVKNQIYVQTPPSLQDKIESLWRIARTSYGF